MATSRHYSLRLDPESQAILVRAHSRRAKGKRPRISDSAMIQALMRLGERYQNERGKSLSLEEMLRASPTRAQETPAAPARPTTSAPPSATGEPEPPRDRIGELAALAPEVTALRRARRISTRPAMDRLCALSPGLDPAAAWDWLQGGTVPRAGEQLRLLHTAVRAYAVALREDGADEGRAD